MTRLILTRGIQASGKSTWARQWVRQAPDRRIRVNRDDLRRMMFATEGTLLPWKQEQLVTTMERAIAKAALDEGKDVVVDAMNLRAKWVRGWATLGYPIAFRDFPILLEDALLRNAARGWPVPDEAIRKAFRLTPGGNLPTPPDLTDATPRPYEPDWELPGAFIFDIDGTLAHMTGRSPYDFSRVHEDVADKDVAYLLGALSRAHRIVIISGREETCRDVTEAWLRAKGIPYDELYMLPEGDGRKDSIVKRELFDAHVRHRFNVHGVVDDRPSVCRMWRSLGLRVYQVGDPDKEF